MTTSRSRDPDRDRSHWTERGAGRGPDQDHPSFLALDRAALGSRTAHLSRHLDECARCRAHMERITDPAPVPEGARGWLRREAPARPARPRRSSRAWLNGLTAAATAAVIVAAVLVGRDRPVERAPGRETAADPRFDTAKGGRAVGVYVRRGPRTFLWNGTEPVVPGDTLRLKLVPDGMTQVHVFGHGPGGHADLELLHRAELVPDRDSLLDTAWRVDDQGGREVLIVVLSRRPLGPAAALAAARAGGMGEELWVTRLVLPKRPVVDLEVVP
ncbi:MAG TPA: hypothetical protein VNO33_24880 [Kofleriaceae bacterium]|nr:hypothetical protein [Kofleriaceae bacterium]